MDLDAIINSAADVADDFLSDASSMTEARGMIRAYLTEHHTGVKKPDTERVIAGVLPILDEEGFFESSGKRDEWSDDDSDERAVE